MTKVLIQCSMQLVQVYSLDYTDEQTLLYICAAACKLYFFYFLTIIRATLAKLN